MINICPNCKGIIGNEKICPKCGADTTKPPKITEKTTDKSEIISTINQSLVDIYTADTKATVEQKINKRQSRPYKKRHRYNIKSWIITASFFVSTLVICAVVIILIKKNNFSFNGATISSQDEIVSNEISEEVSKTPIESLNDREKEIFEAFISGVDTFKVPQSARLLDIKKITKGRGSCLITVTAENKMGGTVKEECILFFGDGSLGRKIASLDDLFVYRPEETINYEDVDVGNINRAIKQHWEDLGID